jgi:hypothetical protein
LDVSLRDELEYTPAVLFRRARSAPAALFEALDAMR